MNNANVFDLARGRLRTGLAEADRKRGWYIALGVFLVILGSIAATMAVATTLLTVQLLGWTLILAGVGLAIHSFLTAKWSGFLLTLTAGAFSAIAGFTFLTSPVAGAAAITLMFGGFLVAAGVFRSVSSLVMRFPNWGWALVSGIVSFALGAMLLRSWQAASLLFLGLYVGIDLIVHGFSWMAFGFGVHRLAREFDVRGEEERRAA